MPNTQMPVSDSGTVTSAGTAVDITVSLGFRPAYVEFISNAGGTNPNVVKRYEALTNQTILVTGTTGVVTKKTDATGILITDTGFTVDSTVQTNSGINAWFAVRK